MKPSPEKPKRGQESVWDYPRPPKLEPVKEILKIVHEGKIIAQTSSGFRVLETSHPPVYYFPPKDVNMKFLSKSPLSTHCEFKGRGNYFHLELDGKKIENVAWQYRNPNIKFNPIKNYIAFYASKMDACYVGTEKVDSQAGDFYGGWITSKIVGPFKGEPGTWGW